MVIISQDGTWFYQKGMPQGTDLVIFRSKVKLENDFDMDGAAKARAQFVDWAKDNMKIAWRFFSFDTDV